VSATARFEFVEGATGDLSFVARGATAEEAIAAAAEAFLAATVEEPESVGRSEPRRVEIDEASLDLALLRFLNELVYLRDAEELLLHAARVQVARNGGVHLAAELVGERIDRARHRLAADVKAATAHGLRITREGAGFRATVTLDV
jgi:SHS2 domain-containing protein